MNHYGDIKTIEQDGKEDKHGIPEYEREMCGALQKWLQPDMQDPITS
jgi:hypothetical protein